MGNLTTSQYSLLHQAESWLARQVGTDLLEFPGNHMTYLTEPTAVADGLRPQRERSAEPDTRPGIGLGGRVNDPASLVAGVAALKMPPARSDPSRATGAGSAVPDLGSSATTAGTSFAAWKLGRWNLLE